MPASMSIKGKAGDQCSMHLQAAMVGELYRLAEKSQKQVQKPTGQGRLLQWYFFLVTAFWMYFRWGCWGTPETPLHK